MQDDSQPPASFFGHDNTSMSLTTSSGTPDDLLTQEVVIVTSYLSVLLLLSLVTNGTIGCVFYTKPQLLTVSNYFVLNLACCQLGLSLLILPFCLVSVSRGQWVVGDAWCRGASYLLVVLLVTLHFSLVAISLDRTFAIVSSLRYPYVFTHTRGSIVVAGTWVLGLAIGVPPLVGWGAFTFNQQQHLCTVDWQADSAYTLLFLALVFFLPLLLQCCCYLCIFRAALGHSKRSAKVFPSSTTATTITATTSTVTTPSSSDSCSDERVSAPAARSSGSTECKAVKTIVLIAAAYLACWTLFVVVALLQWCGADVAPSVQLAASALLFLSGVVNPLIYGFMNRLTRFEIWKLWRRLFQRLSGRPPTTFTTDNDDGISSTWTTTVPSSRQPSSLWVVPAPRVRHTSHSAACTVHNMEMVTIREESELEEDGGRQERTKVLEAREVEGEGPEEAGSARVPAEVGARAPEQTKHQAACVTSAPGCSYLSSGTSLVLEPADSCEANCRVRVKSARTGRTNDGGTGKSQILLNPARLHEHSLPPGRRRSSTVHVPRTGCHQQYPSHHHPHRQQMKSHQGRIEDVWDLFCVDLGLTQVETFAPSAPGRGRCTNRHSSADVVSMNTDSDSSRCASRTNSRKRSGRERWKFVQVVYRFLRRHENRPATNVQHRGDSDHTEQSSSDKETRETR